ncbi:hypothetical protein EXN66_Car005121 [Channa argus]|uniref:Uncharacterized protein n=1 Tax=Channa argus TaxID=215402 RepID=A0A6G1PGW5_CHAAH|nr:hypothetical protein EXN66_Car005121 [Channa argus]
MKVQQWLCSMYNSKESTSQPSSGHQSESKSQSTTTLQNTCKIYDNLSKYIKDPDKTKSKHNYNNNNKKKKKKRMTLKLSNMEWRASETSLSVTQQNECNKSVPSVNQTAEL